MKVISIIIPIYNVEKYVAECLNSVISQTYDHSKIECIIVNDCTPDKSMDIVNKIIGKYSGEMTFITHRHKENKGYQIFVENEMLNYCNHPNIIKIFGFYEDKESFYLVEEYCQKGDLAEFLNQNSILTKEEMISKSFD